MIFHTLLLFILTVLPSVFGQQASVRFEDTAVSIEEGAIGFVRLRKIGATSSPVSVIVKVS